MAAKKGFFQKADKKKQYSDNVLNNVESAYRPKNRGRVKNPISSNTMSGEEPDTLEENVEQELQSTQEGRRRNPVGYAFAGPQAKRQKLEAQAEVNASAKVVAKGEEKEEVASAKVFAAPLGFEQSAKPASEPKVEIKKRKTQIGMPKNTPKKSRKLSQPEIRVTTGMVEKKLSQPEIRVTTGLHVNESFQPEIQAVEPTAAVQEKIPAVSEVSEVLEAMQTLEADVQASKGNYEPIQESELQTARSMGFLRLFSNRQAINEMQYELEFDSISADEFDQSQEMKHPEPQALDGNAHLMSFEAAPIAEEIDQNIADSIADGIADEIADTISEIAAQAELFEEPLFDQARSAELGLSFEPQNYRKDTKKTQFLTVPTQGIRRSNRGTIEAVFQPNGKVVEAQYNRCGILIEVSVAGAMKLTRSAETGRWSMSYSDGSQPVNSVSNVAFDRLGNLCYITEDGHTTVICADGRVVEK